MMEPTMNACRGYATTLNQSQPFQNPNVNLNLRGCDVCYLKAKDVLPVELIELLQQYVAGEYLYIPKKEHHKLE